MIAKMKKESAREATKQKQCDSDIAENTSTRDKLNKRIEALNTKIDGLNAEIDRLDQEMKQLEKENNDLHAARAKATDDRTASKAAHDEFLEDTKGALEATKRALAVLQEYYAKAAKATGRPSMASPKPPVFE